MKMYVTLQQFILWREYWSCVWCKDMHEVCLKIKHFFLSKKKNTHTKYQGGLCIYYSKHMNWEITHLESITLSLMFYFFFIFIFCLVCILHSFRGFNIWWCFYIYKTYTLGVIAQCTHQKKKQIFYLT